MDVPRSTPIILQIQWILFIKLHSTKYKLQTSNYKGGDSVTLSVGWILNLRAERMKNKSVLTVHDIFYHLYTYAPIAYDYDGAIGLRIWTLE